MNQQQLDNMVTALTQGIGNAIAAAIPAAGPAAAAAAPRPREVTVAPLTEATPEAWKAWRTKFEATALLNNWDAARQRMIIFVSMQGKAGEAVAHLPHGVPQAPAGGGPAPPCPAAVDYLDELEARFVPPAAGKVARRMYRAAKQMEKETVGAFHSRLRALAVRAHPTWTAHDIETNLDLIGNFAEGLRNDAVVEHVLRCDPQTYAAALTDATAELQITHTMKSRKTGKPVDPNVVHADLFAMEEQPTAIIAAADGAGPSRRQCFECRSTDHAVTECPKATCYRCGRKGHIASSCTDSAHSSWNRRGRPYPARGQRSRGNGRYRGRGRYPRGGNRGRGTDRRAVNLMAAADFLASLDANALPNHGQDSNSGYPASGNC